MEQPTKPNPTDRPTMGDLAWMIADRAEEFGTIRGDNDQMDDEATATRVLDELREMAQELTANAFNASSLGILAKAVTAYGLHLNPNKTEERAQAEAGAKVMGELVALLETLTKYRPQLEILTKVAISFVDEATHRPK